MDEALTSQDLPGRKVTFLKGLAFLVIMAALIAGGVFFAQTQRATGGAIVAVETPQPISVEVVAVARQDRLALQERFSGIAETRRTSLLGFERGGRITRLRVDVGDQVAAGQELASLDTRALEAQLNAAMAQVDEARAARDLALATVQRLRPLFDDDLTPKQRIDEAEAALTQAEARIAAGEAQADLIRVQIGLSSISAPFDGMVTARLSDEGTIASPSQPVLRIAETGEVEFRFGLPAKLAANLEAGDLLELTTIGGEPVPTVVKALTGVVDPTLRTVEVVFETTGERTVPPGTIVSLSFERTVPERGFWVPVTALNEASRGLWTVYVAEDDGSGDWVAAQRLVEIIQAEENRAYVRGPIEDGEKVIRSGLQRLTPGMPVTPVDASGAALADLDGRKN